MPGAKGSTVSPSCLIVQCNSDLSDERRNGHFKWPRLKKEKHQEIVTWMLLVG